eukprot:TRINITY_DN8484_c0_g1_i3.p1 TRINITY_DN8484_c0_g1~~TRINITY_DN8484_c0_g1_i3.p1  ORF type:complete len:103 (+),score=13.13 TRINITY_DN8484_c0_g1_i3:45-353(+)
MADSSPSNQSPTIPESKGNAAAGGSAQNFKNDISKLRSAPDFYFMPRRPLWLTTSRAGACIASGLFVGMWVETWIRNKVKEDGGYIVLRSSSHSSSTSSQSG